MMLCLCVSLLCLCMRLGFSLVIGRNGPPSRHYLSPRDL